MRKRRFEIFATVFDKKGRILAREQNSYSRTHPMMYTLGKKVNNVHRCFLHAEVAAIIKGQKHGIPYKIKVERYDKSGNPKLAAPCPICCEAIRLAGIKLVEYTIG